MNKRILYWSLIITFTFLYGFVGFVSTWHSITFFEIANSTLLATLLGVSFEVSQIAVLFSLLISDNKNKFLPWLLMCGLTGLQITANVYASYQHMIQFPSEDWKIWKDAILYSVDAENATAYKVIISWVQGGLLPLISLGLTALVVDNINLLNNKEKNIVNTLIDEKKSLININDLNSDLDSEISSYIPEPIIDKTKVSEKKETNLETDNNRDVQAEANDILSKLRNEYIGLVRNRLKKTKDNKQEDIKEEIKLVENQDAYPDGFCKHIDESIKDAEESVTFDDDPNLKLIPDKDEPYAEDLNIDKHENEEQPAITPIIEKTKDILKDFSKNDNTDKKPLVKESLITDPVPYKPQEGYVPTVLAPNGVEVINVKKVPGKIDKFGLPIKPGDSNDKI